MLSWILKNIRNIQLEAGYHIIQLIIRLSFIQLNIQLGIIQLNIQLVDVVSSIY